MTLTFSIDQIFLILNFLVTILCGLYIFYSILSKKIGRHLFYYFWCVGFILYAMQILTRAFFISPGIIGVLLISSYFVFVLGLWFLGRRKLFLISFIVVFVTSMFLFSVGGIIGLVSIEDGKIFASVAIYGGLTLLMFYHRTIFGRTADKFIIGWLILCITNLFLPTEWFATNIFAIFSKIVLLAGVMDQDFSILLQKVKLEIMSDRLPIPFTTNSREGIFKLIIHSNNVQSNKIKFLKQRIQENVRKEETTYIFSFQDVIPRSVLRELKWISPNKVKVFLFSSSANTVQKEFTILPMGITEIGATISEIIKKHLGADDCTIIFSDLSLLIHVFGIYPIYNLLLSKMGGFREAGIEMLVFFHPETHGDNSVPSLFESISDEVIKL